MRTLTLTFFLFSAIALSAQEARTPLESEAQRFAATVNQDVETLATLLHDDLLYIHSNGFEERGRAYIESVSSGKINYQSFESLVAPSLVQLSKKIALIDGKVAVSGLYEGEPFTVVLRYTSTYFREKKQWKLIRWQSLKVDS